MCTMTQAQASKDLRFKQTAVTGFFTNGPDVFFFPSFFAGHESKSEKIGISQDLIESTCFGFVS